MASDGQHPIALQKTAGKLFPELTNPNSDGFHLTNSLATYRGCNNLDRRNWIGSACGAQLPLADDGLPFRFALLVELVHILHGSPVGNVPHLAFTKGAVEHGAAGQQPDVSLVQRGTGCPVHIEFNAGRMRPASLVISTNAVRLPTHRLTAA